MYHALHRKSRPIPVRVQTRHELGLVTELFRSGVRLSKAIQAVQRLSLAAQVVEGSERVIRIHDLVQLPLRWKLVTDVEQREWLKITVHIICKGFKAIGDRRSPQNWIRCSRFVSHIESLERLVERYGFEEVELLNASKWIAVYLGECGLYERAAIFNQRTLERKTSILGEKHPSTLTSMNNIAWISNKQGKYKEAEGIHRRVVASCESELGRKHPDTLTSMNNLALVLNRQGKYEEAKGIHQSMLSHSIYELHTMLDTYATGITRPLLHFTFLLQLFEFC